MLRTKDKSDERYQRGFTIIELLVVIALMTILISIAGVSIVSSLRQSRLRDATRELEGDFSTIRNKARTQQRNVVSLLTPTDITAFLDTNNNGTYEVDAPFVDRNGNGVYDLGIDTPGGDYIDVNVNGVYDPGIDTPGRFLHHAFTNGVQFAVTSDPGAGAVAPLTTIRFNAMGNITDANRVVTITLQSEAKRQYRIRISQTGSTRVERSDDAGISWPTRPW
jgi:prepilin-type N-terminal cleavage/methylation domain-containing protein